MPDIKLLDCTLRDGGYVNSWNWGFAAAKDIIASLTRAGTDIVEVGFLRNVDGYSPDVTVCNTIEELNRLLPAHTGSTMYSGMAMRSNYDIAKLSPYEGHGIEMLRIPPTITISAKAWILPAKSRPAGTSCPSTPSTLWAMPTKTCCGF